jgi:hypothetical protein
MLLTEVIKVPIVASLGIIAAILAASVVASLLKAPDVGAEAKVVVSTRTPP